MIANIALDDALILPHRANPRRIEFSGTTGGEGGRKMPADAIGANVSAQFEKTSPFCRRIARTIPHLSQCDAIATGYPRLPLGGREGLHAAYFRNRDSWGRDIRESAINECVGLR
jgi:hypothetical protein